MNSSTTAKTITLRLAPADYRIATSIAKRKNLSINKMFLNGLRLLEEKEKERQLFDDFTAIGKHTDVADVEFALSAQSQVVVKHEPD